MADKRLFAKLDLGYFDNLKTVGLIDGHPRALLLHLRAILYARQHLTDGQFPPSKCARDVAASADDLKALADAGLVVQREDGTWWVHDYAEHQETAEKVAARSASATAAINTRWSTGRTTTSNTGRNTGRTTERNTEERRGEESIGASTTPRKKASTRLPDDWHPTDAHRTYAADSGIDLEHELAQFLNHHAAKDSRFVDWNRAFSTWLGNAKKWAKPTLAAAEFRPTTAVPPAVADGRCVDLYIPWRKAAESGDETAMKRIEREAERRVAG